SDRDWSSDVCSSDLASSSRDRSEVPIERSREDDAWNDRHSCGLCRTAAFAGLRTRRRFGAPHLLSIRKLQSQQAATGFRTHLSVAVELYIRNGNVDVFLIRCGSPLDSTNNAAFPGADLP